MTQDMNSVISSTHESPQRVAQCAHELLIHVFSPASSLMPERLLKNSLTSSVAASALHEITQTLDASIAPSWSARAAQCFVG